MPERGDVLLLGELVLDEGVKELVVEGFAPRLAGEHCAEVRAALTHDLLEADHGGALGGHCYVLGRGREPDDVCPVVDEHRLLPRDAQLQLWVGESDPHQNVHHPLTVVIGDGRQELVERLDCHSDDSNNLLAHLRSWVVRCGSGKTAYVEPKVYGAAGSTVT